jgi:hypothetical protein
LRCGHGSVVWDFAPNPSDGQGERGEAVRERGTSFSGT